MSRARPRPRSRSLRRSICGTAVLAAAGGTAIVIAASGASADPAPAMTQLAEAPVGTLDVGGLSSAPPVAGSTTSPNVPTSTAATPTTTTSTTTSTTTTVYVSPNGNDLNAGSTAKPLQTVAAALAKLPATGLGQVYLKTGTYPPAVVTRPNTVIASVSGATPTFTGQAGVANVILVKASKVTLRGLTVAGCVPNPTPPQSFEDSGSAGIRVDDNVSNVTITASTIRDGVGVNNDGGRFGCYGVLLHNSTSDTVSNNDLSNGGYGVYVKGGGGHTITGNKIHDNTAIMRNTKNVSGDDFGAVGIGFMNTSVQNTASNNDLWNNVGPSFDYGHDGGAFEIYNASNVVMTGNRMHDNDNFLETGAGVGGNCINNKFTNNTASGRSNGPGNAPMVGIILRCAQGMQVTGNTMSNVNWWMFWIYERTNNSGTVRGLTIMNNSITQQYDKVYSVTSDLSGRNVVIQKNVYSFRGTFWSDWLNANLPITDWRSRMSFDTT